MPVVFWLLVWAAAAAGTGSELLLPSPTAVMRALGRLMLQPVFWRSVGTSFLRVGTGLVLGTAAALVCALFTLASPLGERLISPAVRVIRAAPVTSFILLVLLWTARTAVPVVICGMTVLPVVWESVRRGTLHTSPQLLEMAKAYRFGKLKTLWLIYIPSVLPHFAGGMNTALGLAWKSGVAAEVLCRPRLAVGSAIYNAKLSLETPELFAWTAVVIGLSVCLERLFGAVMNRAARTGGKA